MAPPLRKNLAPSVLLRAFTLLELLVTVVILVVVIGIATRMVSGVSDLWLRQRGGAVAFEGANSAFEALGRTFAQAALNTYWDYDPPTAPTRYRRASDLHFLMGPAGTILPVGTGLTTSAAFFQAPLGQAGGVRRLPALLNGVGYFIRYDRGEEVPSFLVGRVPERWRFRLYEWVAPTTSLDVYRSKAGRAWVEDQLFEDGQSNRLRHVEVMAENIIGLILMAEYPDGAGGFTRSYLYDSRDSAVAIRENQLPPRVHVTMVALDEASATRLSSGATPPPILPEADWFQNPVDFDDDLRRWEGKLQALSPRVNYLILSATVTIENSRWSP